MQTYATKFSEIKSSSLCCKHFLKYDGHLGMSSKLYLTVSSIKDHYILTFHSCNVDTHLAEERYDTGKQILNSTFM